MSKRVPVAIWFGVAGLGVGALVALRLVLAPPPPPPLVIAPPTKPDPEMKKLVTAPRPPIEEKAKPSLSLECRNFWNGLRGLRLVEMLESNPDRKSLPQGTTCEQIPPELKSIHDRYAQACKDFTNADLLVAARANDPRVVECRGALVMYRAKLSDWLTREISIDEIRDLQTLSDKLIARFQDDPEKGAEIAERMLKLNPDLYPAAKASILGKLIGAQKAAGNRPEGKEWAAVEEAIARAQQISKAEPSEMLETEAVITDIRYRDPGKLWGKAKEISEENPQLGIGPFLQGWAKFREGDHKAAKDYLQEALKREPESARYQESLDKLTSGEALPFRVGLSFSDPSQTAN